MTKLEERLAARRSSGRIGLMTHVVVGYPSLAATVDLVRTMADAGADMVELQIPFSDPVADGSTLMEANEAALAGGTRVADCFDTMRELSGAVAVPLLFMSYYNIVFNFGVERFCREARMAGASGLIVPDLNLDEEAEEGLLAACQEQGLHDIRVVTPESTDSRLRLNADVASGFVYCTSRSGPTGGQVAFDPELGPKLERIKTYFSVPLAVGFSVRTQDDVRFLNDYAEIAVVGSRVIEVLKESPESERMDRVATFIKDLLDW